MSCNSFFFILLFQTLSLFPAGDNFRLQNVDGAFYLKKKNTSIILQELKNVWLKISTVWIVTNTILFIQESEVGTTVLKPSIAPL